jgi:hypothetical protein
VEGPETKALENSNGDVPKPKADKKKDWAMILKSFITKII